MRPGQSFENQDVTQNYRFRPDYPGELYDYLFALSPRTINALDLGCGPGKIAIGLAPVFKNVTAVDASESMLQLATKRHLEGSNIDWVHGLAELAELGPGLFDLIVAAASIHWMDLAKLFPRLSEKVSADHVFAVVDGDGAHNPPWKKDWDIFLTKWISLLKDEIYEPCNPDSKFNRHVNAYRDWVDVQGEMIFERDVSQSIDDFINCQHSRDTFAPAKLGSQLKLFDEELRRILEPHAEKNTIFYTVQTRLEWGSIKPSC